VNNFKTIFLAQSSNVSNSEQTHPREVRKLALRALRDALARSIRAVGFSFVGAGALSEYALLASQTWVDLGATMRNVGTFTDREQDGQKPLKINTIATDHARGKHFNLSWIWR
jgi:hypothetical protein